MENIRSAFKRICKEAKRAESVYVSLYVNVPYYGGPEEGGWWGSDTFLVEYQEFQTQEEAEEVVDAIKELAKELTTKAKRAFQERCRSEVEFLEERGLDDDFLPEVDGDETYFVAVEEGVGSLARRGMRHYE